MSKAGLVAVAVLVIFTITLALYRWRDRFPWVQWAAYWHAQHSSINRGHLTTADGVPHIDPNAAIQCALGAHAARQPFYITFDVYGIDEQISNGIIGDSQGKAIEIFYASGVVTPPAHTLLRYRCPLPTRLQPDPSTYGIPRLHCEPRANRSLEQDQLFWSRRKNRLPTTDPRHLGSTSVLIRRG